MTTAAGAPNAGPFSKRVTIGLAVVAGVALVGSVILGIVTSKPPATRAGSDSTNPSALGHSAVVELLRDVGMPVVVTRSRTAQRTAGASLLLLIEPEKDRAEGKGRLATLLAEARCPVVVVLPKWRLVESDGPLRKMAAVRRPAAEVDEVLGAVDRAARSTTLAAPEWTINHFGEAPRLRHESQVVDAKGFAPVIASDGGFLVGERYDADNDWFLAVVADPDIFANHGLHEPPNARLALAIVERFRVGDGPILVDETIHGLGTAESFWARAFQFPLVLATVQAAIAALLLLFAGMRRFGPAQPWTPAFPPGKRFLIDHVAGLLESGGHQAATLERYVAVIQDALGREARAHGADPVAAIARLESKKRPSEPLARLDSDVRVLAKKRPRDARAAHKLAMRLWRWKAEMTDGPRRGSRAGSTIT